MFCAGRQLGVRVPDVHRIIGRPSRRAIPKLVVLDFPAIDRRLHLSPLLVARFVAHASRTSTVAGTTRLTYISHLVHCEPVSSRPVRALHSKVLVRPSPARPLYLPASASAPGACSSVCRAAGASHSRGVFTPPATIAMGILSMARLFRALSP